MSYWHMNTRQKFSYLLVSLSLSLFLLLYSLRLTGPLDLTGSLHLHHEQNQNPEGK